MKELTPLQKKIRDIIVSTAMEEPYITNAAIRISALLPSDLKDVPPHELKRLLAEEKQRGYSSGYIAGKKASK